MGYRKESGKGQALALRFPLPRGAARGGWGTEPRRVTPRGLPTPQGPMGRSSNGVLLKAQRATPLIRLFYQPTNKFLGLPDIFWPELSTKKPVVKLRR